MSYVFDEICNVLPLKVPKRGSVIIKPLLKGDLCYSNMFLCICPAIGAAAVVIVFVDIPAIADIIS